MHADLLAWGHLQLLEPLSEGHRSDVWRGELDGIPVAVRRSRRSEPSLRWELDLLAALAERGVRVAQPIRTLDGRRHVDGIIVQGWLDGRAPDTDADWRRVAGALVEIHDALVEWPQRPGCCTVTELGSRRRSVDADLDAMPGEVADQLVAVFDGFHDVPTSVVHGDPGPTNIRIDAGGRVGLLDFDESRVDLCWHDLSNLGVQVLDDAAHLRAQRLSHAWEAANAWLAEPDYARRRLAALRAPDQGGPA